MCNDAQIYANASVFELIYLHKPFKKFLFPHRTVACVRTFCILVTGAGMLPFAQAATRETRCPDGLHITNGAELNLVNNRASHLSTRLNASTFAIQGTEVADGQVPSIVDDGLHEAYYRLEDIAVMAGVLERLRSLNRGKKILLIGYSGGAAMAALVPSQFPASADAYLLAFCPYDLVKWSCWHGAPVHSQNTLARGLSPLDEVAKVSSVTRISLVVGTIDDNTPARFSEAYAAGLHARGVKTRLTYAAGATHLSVLRSPEFFMLVEELAEELSR